MADATERLRAILEERGVKHDAVDEHVTIVYLEDRYITFLSHGDKFSAEVVYPRPILNATVYLTPEQAIAATLGSDDRYDAGFASGVQATFQQLEGISDFDELQEFIAEYWGEGEGNDEP